MFYDYYSNSYPDYYGDETSSPLMNPFDDFVYPTAAMPQNQPSQNDQSDLPQGQNQQSNRSSQPQPQPSQPSFPMLPGSPVINDINYTQGYLRTLIGKRVKIEFLIGTNMLIDREGTLETVGISYVVIREVDTNYLVMCDIYSIKFVNVFPGQGEGQMTQQQ